MSLSWMKKKKKGGGGKTRKKKNGEGQRDEDHMSCKKQKKIK